MVKELLGAISGGTLGYITGGVHGARTGMNLGRNLSKMPPTETKRGRSTSVSTARTRRRPSSSRASSDMDLFSRSRSRSRSTIRIARPRKRVRFSGRGNASDVDVRKPKKPIVSNEGRKKTVKVSRKLRAKINRVIQGKDPIGIFQEISMEGVMLPADNAQGVFQIGFSETIGTTPITNIPIHFSPISILNASSILWNNKQPVNPKGLTDNNNFSPQIHKVILEDSWVQFTYHNNTARTMFLFLWDVSLKHQIPGTTTGTNPPVYLGAAANWLNMSLQNQPTAITDSSYENPLKVVPTTLYAKPTYVPAFNHMYTSQCTKVTLEAGKEYKHILKGPKNKLYNFAKFWNGLNDQSNAINFISPQKFTKEHICVCHWDLTNTTLQTPGRFTDIVTNSPYGLLCETRTMLRLRMPNQAGTVGTGAAAAAGVGIPLNRRTYSYAIQNWVPAQAGIVTAIEDENPQAPTTTGV